MLVGTKFRLVDRKDGLRDLPNILNRNMRGGLETVGKRLRTSAQSRMRKDTGREQRSLSILVQGRQLGLRLTVFSTLVQAFVDAYGLRRGVFPNFRINSEIYKWAEKHSRVKKTVRKSKKVTTPIGPVPHLGIEGQVATYNRRKIGKIKKLTRSKSKSGTAFSLARNRAKQTNSKRLAFLIARAIFNRGIKPTNWNMKALIANKQMILREMQNAISRTVNELGRV